MDLSQKLSILGESARYDVSCSTSGVERKNSGRGVGNTTIGGICHTWTGDGRCVSLLKVLLTNHCEYDCVYCANRASNDIPRAAFQPAELAELTMTFYRRNYIEGLFLSSGVVKSPEHTAGLMIRTLELLRGQHRFQGYIHTKIIPGVSAETVARIGLLSDRISVNMEQCTQQSLKQLAPQKSPQAIAKPMSLIAGFAEQNSRELKQYRHAPHFAPAGQSTQIIIGASPERDIQILSSAQRLYDQYSMKRVYYSAYVPINRDSRLPAIETAPPLLREHRLYQADWLMRFYNFEARELLSCGQPDLDLELDPKCAWALNHLDQFPVEINRADYETLLRVPGIGVQSARKILAARRERSLKLENLKAMRIVMKRASWFITCDGKSGASRIPSPEGLRLLLADREGSRRQSPLQLSLEDLAHAHRF